MTCINFGNTIVCMEDESESDGLDLRTRKGQEEHVLRQIRDHGGFSISWVTENQKRAHAAQRLIDGGRIVRMPDEYPWCSYRIKEQTDLIKGGER